MRPGMGMRTVSRGRRLVRRGRQMAVTSARFHTILLSFCSGRAHALLQDASSTFRQSLGASHSTVLFQGHTSPIPPRGLLRDSRGRRRNVGHLLARNESSCTPCPRPGCPPACSSRGHRSGCLLPSGSNPACVRRLGGPGTRDGLGRDGELELGLRLGHLPRGV